jgi:hypothetical protein
MGTWAAGNFDNDGALDYMGELMDLLTARVEESFDAGAALDEEGEAILMPSIEVMALLSENCKTSPPDAKTVRKWKKKYLRIYDSEIDDLLPADDFKQERRKVIETTFDRLEKVAAGSQKK